MQRLIEGRKEREREKESLVRQIEGEGEAEVERRIKWEKDKREGDIIQIQRYERKGGNKWDREIK